MDEESSAPGGIAPDDGHFRQITTDYLARLGVALDQLDIHALMRIVERLRVVRDRGATVFLAGNGGSAATASHWVNDLAKATRRSGRDRFRIIGLADNVSWFSALANDEGYERVFTGQLENLARGGDLLIVISASGNSPNLVDAVEYANAIGMVTIGLLGFDGGRLRTIVHDALWVPTELGDYGLAESAHSIACDIITTCLIEDRSVDATTPR
ncbi:MAG: SIS domain-containing protein [Candidatus Limnocylindrales bacterium]